MSSEAQHHLDQEMLAELLLAMGPTLSARGRHAGAVSSRSHKLYMANPWEPSEATTLGAADFKAAYHAANPAFKAEDELQAAIEKAKSAGDVEKALNNCLKSGGRDGSDVVKVAQKL